MGNFASGMPGIEIPGWSYKVHLRGLTAYPTNLTREGGFRNSSRGFQPTALFEHSISR